MKLEFIMSKCACLKMHDPEKQQKQSVAIHSGIIFLAFNLRNVFLESFKTKKSNFLS